MDIYEKKRKTIKYEPFFFISVLSLFEKVGIVDLIIFLV